MSITKTDILVYAHWLGMKEPKLIGILYAQQAKGKKAFSFEYSDDWIQSTEQILLDPDIGWYKGQQYPNGKENFGIFFDSMPDTWGRTLMKRYAAQKAREEGKPVPNLYDIDFLLGVYDECRMGALRFKLDSNGPFLENSKDTPMWKRIIFNIAISNTDDHLRNHGFILTQNGWILSPAFDINPSIDKNGLALNIDTDDNALDFELAKSVGEFFQLTDSEMETIITEVKKAVSSWKVIAQDIGIPKSEQEIMASAFKY